MNVLEQINEEFAKFEAKKAELVNELRKKFPEILAPLFEKSKLIESVGWSQYTPYFNDGDECTFGVNELDYINGEYKDELDWYTWEVKYPDKVLSKEINKEECLIFNEIADVIESIPDDILKDLFGDHVQITIHKDGNIEVEEYDHD